MPTEIHSVEVLEDCLTRQSEHFKKFEGQVEQSVLYPHGCYTLYDKVWMDLLQIQIMLKETGKDGTPTEVQEKEMANYVKSAINNLSYFLSYYNGKMDGRKETIDIYGQCKFQKAKEAVVDRKVLEKILTAKTIEDREYLPFPQQPGDDSYNEIRGL